MSMTDRWEALERKCRSIERRGMTPLIVTQFAFDADSVLAWLKALRERGIEHPVRVGAWPCKHRGAGTLCRLVRRQRMRFVMVQVRRLHRQAVRLGGAGSFC